MRSAAREVLRLYRAYSAESKTDIRRATRRALRDCVCARPKEETFLNFGKDVPRRSATAGEKSRLTERAYASKNLKKSVFVSVKIFS